MRGGKTREQNWTIQWAALDARRHVSSVFDYAYAARTRKGNSKRADSVRGDELVGGE